MSDIIRKLFKTKSKELRPIEIATIDYLTSHGTLFGSRSLGVESDKSDYDFFVTPQVLADCMLLSDLEFVYRSTLYTLLENIRTYNVKLSNGLKLDILVEHPQYSKSFTNAVQTANALQYFPKEYVILKEDRCNLFANIFKFLESDKQLNVSTKSLISKYCPELLI